MNVFFVIAIIILTVSNVLLWIISKGLQIMFKNLANKVVELGEASKTRCISAESEDEE